MAIDEMRRDRRNRLMPDILRIPRAVSRGGRLTAKAEDFQLDAFAV